MATPRLFKLKAQSAPSLIGPVATDLAYAKIWVDTGVFHLDEAFDYQVPEKLAHLVETGVRVQVPFGSREVEGIVIERLEHSDSLAKMKAMFRLSSSCTK